MQSKYAIGIDIGGTKILHALVDLKLFKVIDSIKIKTQRNISPAKCMQTIHENIAELCQRNRLSMAELTGIGIGVPGIVNSDQGYLHIAPNLGWKDISLASIIKEMEHSKDKFDAPVKFANDVNAALLAEMAFLKQDGHDLSNKIITGIFCGTGIGGVIAFDGKIMLGAGSGAGEIGHIVIKDNGHKCGCGNYGCLESEIGKNGLHQFIRQHSDQYADSPLLAILSKPEKRIKSSKIRNALQSNDPLARALQNHYLNNLAIGIANIVNFLNPDIIILGGGMMAAFDDGFNDRLIEKVDSMAILGRQSKSQLMLSRGGDYSGILGTALLGQRQALTL